jgi:hypothetical protein
MAQALVRDMPVRLRTVERTSGNPLLPTLQWRRGREKLERYIIAPVDVVALPRRLATDV